MVEALPSAGRRRFSLELPPHAWFGYIAGLGISTVVFWVLRILSLFIGTSLQHPNGVDLGSGIAFSFIDLILESVQKGHGLARRRSMSLIMAR